MIGSMVSEPKPRGHKIPTKILDEDITAQSSLVIAGLNGNKDKQYEIVIQGTCALTTDPKIDASSLTAGWIGQSLMWRTSTNPLSEDGTSSGKPLLGKGYIADGSAHKLHIRANLFCESGYTRWLEVFSKMRYAGYSGGSIIYAEHDSDTTTNITSLTLAFGGSFTGNVKVYKVNPE